MALKVERVDTWAATLDDRPGGLSDRLEVLATAGANLEFVIARRSLGSKGPAVVFVTPLKGATQCRTARKAGFQRTKSLHAVRIEGSNKKGEGAKITRALAEKGMNLRGLSAAAIGKRFVAHIALDSSADAARAIRLLKQL